MGGITAARREGRVAVGGGRHLGYAEFGAATGPVVVWMHGTPGGRRQVPEAARVHAAARGIRIIGLDRPGIGASSPHLYGSIVEFADDLERAADALGVAEFAIVGLSGGGPYALAAGARLGRRVLSVGSLGGVAPSVGPDAIDGGAVELAHVLRPMLIHGRVPLGLALTGLLRLAAPFGSAGISLFARYSRPGDRRFLGRPESKEMFLGDLISATRDQCSAPLCDALLFAQDWGFRLAEVEVPVHWWHGDDDNIIPLSHGAHCVRQLPDATMYVLAGESHLGGLTIGRDVIDTLVPALLPNA